MEEMIDNGTIIYWTLVTFAVVAYVLERFVEWIRREKKPRV